jgi:hypothetical protein
MGVLIKQILDKQTISVVLSDWIQHLRVFELRCSLYRTVNRIYQL